MGRPINKRYFGLTSGSSGTEGNNITINCQVGSNAESAQGIILAQRSVRTFKVNDAANNTGNEGICTLVDAAAGSLGANEMSIVGYLSTGGGTPIRIAKLYNRTCRDFSNNRYQWAVTDDSSANYIVLTAI
jgi:hypothetical protein